MCPPVFRLASWSGVATPTAYLPGDIEGPDFEEDTWGIVSSIGGITPFNGTSFWGMNDLNDGAFQSGEHQIVYDVAFTAGTYTSLNVSFYYNEVGFDNTDDIGYRYTVGTDAEVVVTLDKTIEYFMPLI